MKRIEELPRRIKTGHNQQIYEFRIYVYLNGDLGVAYVKPDDTRDKILVTNIKPNQATVKKLSLFQVSSTPTLKEAIEETHNKIKYFKELGAIECLT
jgi:hypothetical protein